MMDYSFTDLLGFSPFDPERNKPITLPGGSYATEYSATSQDPNGDWIVHPQIWWDADGQPHFLGGDAGLQAALIYEANTGKTFPRFKSVEDADTFASERSKRGGGTQGGIATLKK